MRKLLFDCGVREGVASMAALVLRICLSSMMLFGHGLGKIEKFSMLSEGWHVTKLWPMSWMSPSVSLMATIAAEVGFSILILMGLCGRWAAFGLSYLMVVIVFEVHSGMAWFSKPGVPMAREMMLLYLVGYYALVWLGSGRYSLDRLLYTPDNKRRRSAR